MRIAIVEKGQEWFFTTQAQLFQFAKRLNELGVNYATTSHKKTGFKVTILS